MRNKAAILFVFVISFMFLFEGCASKDAPSVSGEAARVSRPLEYGGFSYPEYDGFIKSSEYAEMRDGTKLAVDIFLPSGGPKSESYPVIFLMLPYTRAFGIPDMKWYHKIALKMLVGSTSPVIDISVMNKEVPLFLSHGYAYAIADMRGTGASFGTAYHPIPENMTDTEDMLEWIASQSWCDGNIGMYGGSYKGYIQLVAASHKHKALKCIVPIVAPMGFADLVYPGGIYDQGLMKKWSDMVSVLNMNLFIPKPDYPLPMILPSMPAVDEDGDGDYIDEIPIHDENGSFLNGPPKYRDGQPRKNIYYNATMEHTKNVPFYPWSGDMRFVDSPTPTPYRKVRISDMLVYSYMPEIMESAIPVYTMGHWHDAYLRSSTELYCTLRKTNPSKMMIGAGYHTKRGIYWGYNGVDEEEWMDGFRHELLRFFDRHLKGIENGIEKEPPVRIFVQKKGAGIWRFENEWPLKRRVETNFYFNPGNEISRNRKKAGADEYRADFSHDSSYGKHNGNRYLSAASVLPGVLPVRTEKDKKLITYTSAPMENDTEVTGHPIVQFWASSTADYGDFFVYLEDVDPGGKVVLVTEGQHRAGFNKLVDNDLMGTAGIDILPDLPWHGYRKADYTDKVFAGGRIVELYFDLMPTSWVFQKGHRIRVAIACADWPTFRLHPELSPENRPDDPKNIVPTITIYRDAEHSSHIKLPVIPD